MDSNTPLFRWLDRLPFVCLCIGLASCVAAESGAGGVPHGVTEISLKRDCFGCAKASSVLLRSDGSVVVTQVGKARHGSIDQVREGRVSAAEFDTLARLLLQRGFFQMQARYGDPELQDGAWMTVRATRHSQQKEVFVREDGAPPELGAVETAIDALGSRILQQR